MTSHAHDQLLRALQIAVNRDHRARQHQLRVLVTSAALVLLVGAAATAATISPWSTRSKPERSKATILVQTTLGCDQNGLAAGTRIALWGAPDLAGGRCLLLGALNAGVPQRAGECDQNPEAPVYSPGKAINTITSSTRFHGVYDHLVAGSIDPTSGIVKVVLRRATSSTTVSLSHGWFLGDTAPTTTLNVPNTYLVGYNKYGREVARVPVWKGAG